MGAQDIEITARILNGIAPEQMEHVFGLGNLPLYVDAINDPQRDGSTGTGAATRASTPRPRSARSTS